MTAMIGPVLRMFGVARVMLGVARVMLGVSRAARTERPPESEPLKFVSPRMPHYACHYARSGLLIAFSGQ